MATIAAQQRIDTEQKVTTLELFFDLVFVFAFTQVTGLMATHTTWEGVGQGMLVLAAVWWAWGGYAWLTNSLHSDDGLGCGAPFRRLQTVNARHRRRVVREPRGRGRGRGFRPSPNSDGLSIKGERHLQGAQQMGAAL